MKIPTSTSFVMAATASLALQSSARAIPPDSPELSRASPRLAGRAVAMGQFAGRAPNLRSDIRPTTPRRVRGLKIRESPSTDSIDMSLGDTKQLADDIGLGLDPNDRAAEMDTDKSVGESVSIHARQVPDLPVDVPDTVGSLTGEPGQVVGGVGQQGSGIPSTVTGTVGGGLPLPSQAPSGLPVPLPVPLPVLPPIPSNIPLPVGRRDTNLPNPFPGIGQVPGAAAGTIGSTPGDVISGVDGTPVGGVVESAPVNPLANIQGVTDGLANALPGAGEAAGAVTANLIEGLAAPVTQVAGTAGGVAGGTPAGTLIPGGLQGSGQKAAANTSVDGTRPSDYSGSSVEGDLVRRQGDTGNVEDDDGDAAGMTSPTPSSESSPIVADAPVSPDGNAYDESEYETDMSKRQNLPIQPLVNPLSMLPVPMPSLPVGNLPFPSGAPMAAPIPIVVPSLPESAPVGVPIARPSVLPVSLPVSLPVDPKSFIPAKRKRVESPIDPPLPEGFVVPEAPIQGNVPPLLMSRATKEDVGAGVSASVDNPPTAASTVQPGTTMLPPRPTNAQNAPNAPGAPAEGAVSATVEDKVSASRTVQPGTSMVPTSRPVSTSTMVGAVMTTAATPDRRRLFRFNRMQNA